MTTNPVQQFIFDHTGWTLATRLLGPFVLLIAAIVLVVRLVRFGNELTYGFDPYIAPISARVRARLVDGFIILVICGALIRLAPTQGRWASATPPDLMRPLAAIVDPADTPNTALLMAFFALWSATSITYHVLFDSLVGRTPGKASQYLRVVHPGQPPRTPSAAASLPRRALVSVDYLSFGLVGLTSMLLGGDRQRLADRAADTVVLRVPSRRRPDQRQDTDSAPVQTPVEQPSRQPAHVPSAHTITGPQTLDEIELARRAAGAEGERLLQETVRTLFHAGWHAYFGLEHRYFGDVDRLLIGPGGVFVVDAKSHRGIVTQTTTGDTLLRDGEPFEKDFRAGVAKQFNHVRGTLFEDRADVPIQSLIRFTRATILPNEHGRRPRRTCALEDQAPTVLGAPPKLGKAEINALFRVIEATYSGAGVMRPTRGYTPDDWTIRQ